SHGDPGDPPARAKADRGSGKREDESESRANGELHGGLLGASLPERSRELWECYIALRIAVGQARYRRTAALAPLLVLRSGRGSSAFRGTIRPGLLAQVLELEDHDVGLDPEENLVRLPPHHADRRDLSRTDGVGEGDFPLPVFEDGLRVGSAERVGFDVF